MDLEKQIKYAHDKYGPFHSLHEVYGVLMEEVHEFFDQVKRQDDEKRNEKVKYDICCELTQIAAVALRAKKEIEENKIKYL